MDRHTDSCVAGLKYGRDCCCPYGQPTPEPPAPPPETKPKRTCNRHSDCDAANEKAKAEGRNPYTIHCYSEDCEDCFGK